MNPRIIFPTLAILLIGLSASAKEKPRDWQKGTLLDSDRTRYYAGTTGSSDTTGTVDTYGNTGTLTAHSSSEQTAIYRVYQIYAVETNDRVIVGQERIRWRWSKAARLAVNGPVFYFVEGESLYILGEDGVEHKTHIIKEVLKTDSPPAPSTANRLPAAGAATQGAPQPPLPTVAFKSDPTGAEVSVDGKFVGTTPSTLRLAPGEHSIIIQKNGFKDWHRNLSVSEAGNLTIDATLDPNP